MRGKMLSSALAACFAGVCLAAAPFENMNGEYLTTPTPNAPINVTYNTRWSEYDTEHGGVEYFEVELGPIESLYAEVWWEAFPAVPLPDGLAERFDGKGMAIVGYETDSVRKGAGPNGEDVSVPINMAYNHHHDVYLTGKHSRMERVPYDPNDSTVPLMRRAHPSEIDVPVETSPSPNDLPTSLHLADGNGGEYRKSYHGFASPAAYVIDSPQSVYVNPMFIDTWNRDKMNISGGSPFVAGPLPAHSLAPPNAQYSGLLECPMTTRIRKLYPGGNDGWNDTYAPALFQCNAPPPQQQQQQECSHAVGTAEECFSAALGAVGAHVAVRNTTGASDSVAAGCTMTYDAASSTATAYFNTQSDSKACCGAGVTALRGAASSLVDVALVHDGENVTITLTGPADVWYGVGFFAQAMEEKPYALIVDGMDGTVTVTERQLASHMGSAASPGGEELSPRSIALVSTSSAGGLRTVVVTRPAFGPTDKHANFTLQDTAIPFINALGYSETYAHHLNKTASTLALWPVAAPGAAAPPPVCLCKQPAAPFGAAQGIIKYVPTGEQFGFYNDCAPEPRESILAARNPTCDVRAYTGGLQVCKHKWSLLDAEQAQPWPDQPLVYYQKYRFYFQPYEPKRHVIVHPRTVWAIGAWIGEYDVPQCKPGTPPAQCKHEIWGVVTAGGDNLHIAAAHFHCHAPTCLAMEIWNNATGELICRQEPVYGGTGRIAERKFDEPGYIAQPPCLWGDAPGLEPMPLASGVAFTIRAITNNTYGHHGEMAFPEIALVPWNTTANKPQPGYTPKDVVHTQWRVLSFSG